jgi:phosphatidylserine synthase
MATLPVQTALIIHAIAAPLFFACISLFYFRRFNYTSPLTTAICFVGFVMVADFLVMALLVLKSFAMFESPIGTWIPFALIFLSTYLTGLYAERRPTHHVVAP